MTRCHPSSNLLPDRRSAAMTRRDFLGAAAASVLTPAYRSSRASEGREWTTTGHRFSELASFDDAMRDFMQARNIPGGALSVARHGRLILARGYTYTNDDKDAVVQPTSLFRIASVSKPITAAAVLCLAQDGRLDLRAPATDLLPPAPPPGQRPDPRLPDITVLHLLQHLGGWDEDLAFDPMFHDHEISEALGAPLPISKMDIARHMAGQPLQHEPGTTYAYSNYGYSLLGGIVERAAGRPYEDYVRRRVLAPLGITRMALGRTLPHHRRWDEVRYHSPHRGVSVMDNSRLRVPFAYGGFNLENLDSAGGWLASAVDLVRFATALDEPSSSSILDQESIDIMFALPENVDPDTYAAGDRYYGCGWSVRDWGGRTRWTWHTGSLPGSRCRLHRRWDGLTWCAVFNQRDDPAGFDGSIHAATQVVANWPDHDLFREYLPATCVSLTPEQCRREMFLDWKARPRF